MLTKILSKYWAEGKQQIDSTEKVATNIENADLPPNCSDWPAEWQKAHDNRVTIMVSFWPDYSIEKILKQADYWTRYYYRKKQGERDDNEQD